MFTPSPFEVPVSSLPLSRLAPLVGDDAVRALARRAREVADGLRWHTVWNVNSTAAGGGVAEMLPSLLGYAKGAGVPVRWLVIEGEPAFYAITKRIHNGLHAAAGDGGFLGVSEREHYAAINRANFEALAGRIAPGDVVIVHDPQPAGLIPLLRARGVRVAWRCHIGHEGDHELVRRSWDFLRPFLEAAETFVFTREAYAPAWIDPTKLRIIPPSIDPFAPKNAPLSDDDATRIVAHLGLVAPMPGGTREPLSFTRIDGSTSVLKRHADIMHAGPLPAAEAPLVVQVSRWDALKDMAGVMRGFAEHVSDESGAHLALVGPAVHGVSDDPEGALAYESCVEQWRRLPHFRRCRVQLACLPMRDVDENAAMVNAIQRHATVIVQKSLYEGFGLTVTEAMWKGRPVIASAVGGIVDQIEDGVTGRLVSDPTSLEAFGGILSELLAAPDQRARLGAAARDAVRARFLATRHLEQYAALVTGLLSG